MTWKKRLGCGCLSVIGLVVVVLGGYAGYASATADGRMVFADTAYPEIQRSTDPAVIERGRYLVRGPAHCSQCHGSPDRAHPEKNVPTVALAGGLLFDMGPVAQTWAANLTPDRVTGIGRRSDRELARTIRTGVLADGELSIMMRYAAARLSDDDLVAVVSYLRSLPPTRRAVKRGRLGFAGEAMLPLITIGPRTGAAPEGVPAGPEPTVERGRYLAENVMLCVDCHSETDMATFSPTGPKAGGGSPNPSSGADADMEFVPPNLTRHATGMTGRMTEEQFLERMRTGRAYPSTIMPWENFQQTSEVDLRSVYRYLRTLPPVNRDVGPTYRKQGSYEGP